MQTKRCSFTEFRLKKDCDRLRNAMKEVYSLSHDLLLYTQQQLSSPEEKNFILEVNANLNTLIDLSKAILKAQSLPEIIDILDSTPCIIERREHYIFKYNPVIHKSPIEHFTIQVHEIMNGLFHNAIGGANLILTIYPHAELDERLDNILKETCKLRRKFTRQYNCITNAAYDPYKLKTLLAGVAIPTGSSLN